MLRNDSLTVVIYLQKIFINFLCNCLQNQINIQNIKYPSDASIILHLFQTCFSATYFETNYILHIKRWERTSKHFISSDSIGRNWDRERKITSTNAVRVSNSSIQVSLGLDCLYGYALKLEGVTGCQVLACIICKQIDEFRVTLKTILTILTNIRTIYRHLSILNGQL